MLIASLFISALNFTAANAEERILSFRSEIRVNSDGSLDVSETISVIAEGQNIKRGIYRDFPTRYKDRFGNNYVVDFELISVLRDGVNENYRIEERSNGKRIYIGQSEYYIPHGEHVYIIDYRTNRQLGFFKDFDELYWNVTGNDWGFVIDQAQAQVTLPKDAVSQVIAKDAYTGYFGAQGKDFSVSVDYLGNIIFSSTRALAPKEGFTIALSWPKGYVNEPDTTTKAGYFFKDNRAVLMVIIGALFVLVYYLLVWYRFGRDPQKGIIIPLYAPADKLSPASIRYIMKMEYDNKAFAACVMNMAVKGFLQIIEDKGVYTLKRIAQADDMLDDLERKVAGKLFTPFWEVVLQNTNHYVVAAAINELRAGLKKSFEKVYFLTNINYFIPGVILSVIFLLPALFVQPGEKKFLGIFMMLWLSIWSIGVTALGAQVFSLWRGVFRQTANNALFLGGAAGLTLFGLPFFIGEIIGIGVLVYALTPAVMSIIILVVLMDIIFYKLLKAPTFTGRMVMDKIEGFRMYLSAAEGDQLRLINPLRKSPELFEKYLPYALALDVEQAWSERFSDILSNAATPGARYQPGWYVGHWDNMNLSGFTSGLGSSLSGAISSSSTAPGSSSGSGGTGSSGGGGGGGGGGGW